MSHAQPILRMVTQQEAHAASQARPIFTLCVCDLTAPGHAEAHAPARVNIGTIALQATSFNQIARSD